MNLRQVRKKIKSISNVKKITKAMELVSGIKMKRAQTAEFESRAYRNSLQHIIGKLIINIDSTLSLLLTPNHSKKVLTIVITSNKGLCGAYNVNIFRHLVKFTDIKESDYITVGKKGSSFLGRTGHTLIADFSTTTPLDEVSAVFNLALERYLNKEYGKIYLVYSKFISTLKSEVVREQILPVVFSEENSKENNEKELTYTIEPSPEQIIDFLLKSYVENRIRSAIVSSEAVEHSARMIAMKNATDNANEVIYNITLLGNKLRQEKITNELLDMVTAKESVEVN